MFAHEHLSYEAIDLKDRFGLSDAEMFSEARTFYDKMKRRHAVRDYSNGPVDRDIIVEYIRTAGTAPSGTNHQPWHFVAISSTEFKAYTFDQSRLFIGTNRLGSMAACAKTVAATLLAGLFSRFHHVVW